MARSLRKVPVGQSVNDPEDSQLVAQFNTIKLNSQHQSQASDENLNDTLKDDEITSSDAEHYHELATQSDDEQFVRVVSLLEFTNSHFS